MARTLLFAVDSHDRSALETAGLGKADRCAPLAAGDTAAVLPASDGGGDEKLRDYTVNEAIDHIGEPC